MREAKQPETADNDGAGQSDDTAGRLEHSPASSTLRRLAELARDALGSKLCAIAWIDSQESGSTIVGDARASEIDRARTAIAAFQARNAGLPSDGAIVEIASDLYGLALEEGGVSVVVAAAPRIGRSAAKSKVLLELLARAALAEIRGAECDRTLDFWRMRGTAALAQIVEMQDAMFARERDSAMFERMVADISGLAGPDRVNIAGQRIASALGCDRWLVAASADGGVRILASGRAAEPLRDGEEYSAIRECVREGRTIAQNSCIARSRTLPEDRILGGGWTLVRSGPYVIGLGESESDRDGYVAKAEAIAGRLAPIFNAWDADQALADYRALVNRLALRMYAAIDDERASIARDLHDDQAQMLAAAQLALDDGSDQARRIFREISDDLRAKIRTLNPPSLARMTLSEALETHLGRLRKQGLRVELVRSAGAAQLSPGVERLCWQVAREALSNVARHADASAVTVTIDRAAGSVCLKVIDNGRGMADGSAAGATMGLSGIRERLALVGGKLEIESSAGGTIVSVEIPDPA